MSLIRDFNKLDDIWREILIERYINKLSYQSIATKLKLPLGTVKSRLMRAKKKLDFDIEQVFERREYYD